MTEHQFNLALFYMLNRDKGLTFEEMFDIIFDSGHHLENARFLNAVYPSEDDFGKHARIICSRCKDSEIIQLYLKELSYESNPILSSADMFPGQNVEQRMQILRKLHNIKGYFKHPLDRRRSFYSTNSTTVFFIFYFRLINQQYILVMKCRTYQANTRKRSTEFLRQLYDIGRTTNSLNTLQPKKGIGDSRLIRMMLPNPDYHTSIAESPAENKKKILKGKSVSCKKNIRPTSLKQILEVELTTKDKPFDPFWNNYSKEISKKLEWRPWIDGAALETICSNGCSQDLELVSSLKKTSHKDPSQKNWPTILWKSSQSTQQDTTECESIRVVKIRILPTQEQRKLLNNHFGAHRYIYNKCIDYVYNSGDMSIFQHKNCDSCGECNYCKKDIEKLNLNFITLRNKIVRTDEKIRENDEDSEKFLLDIYYDSRDRSVRNFVTMWNIQVTRMFRGHQRVFNMKEKQCKKFSSQVFYAKKSNINPEKSKMFTGRLTNSNIKIFKNDMKKWKSIEKSEKDIIVHKKCEKYYLIIPKPIKYTTEKPKQRIVSLDPGVKTFQTFYSPNIAGDFGNDFVKDQIKPLNKKVDLLNKLKQYTNYRTRVNMNRRQSLLRAKISNKVSHLHKVTAKYLVTNFDIIILPLFSAKNIAKVQENKQVNRDNYTLSHYKFREYMKYKTKVHNKTLVICSESYTTMTCGYCGELNDVDKKREFNCSSCRSHCDRDMNAARNIMIRTLTKYYTGKTDAL